MTEYMRLTLFLFLILSLDGLKTRALLQEKPPSSCKNISLRYKSPSLFLVGKEKSLTGRKKRKDGDQDDVYLDREKDGNKVTAIYFSISGSSTLGLQDNERYVTLGYFIHVILQSHPFAPPRNGGISILIYSSRSASRVSVGGYRYLTKAIVYLSLWYSNNNLPSLCDPHRRFYGCCIG